MKTDTFETKAAAAYISEQTGLPFSPGTLRNMRSRGRGPDCRWFGRRPYYTRDDLDRFIEASTSGQKPPRARPLRNFELGRVLTPNADSTRQN